MVVRNLLLILLSDADHLVSTGGRAVSVETLLEAGELVDLLARNKGRPIQFDDADIALLRQLLAHHKCLMQAYLDLEASREQSGWDCLPARWPRLLRD